MSTDGSDSQSLDDALELLVLAGHGGSTRRWPCSSRRRRDSIGARRTSCRPRVEPWDGPAALVFSDGRPVGALLDRNGLRPLAMARTDDGLVVVSSEAGSIELPDARVAMRHRLGPGQMVVVDAAHRARRRSVRALARRWATGDRSGATDGGSRAASRAGRGNAPALGLDAENVRLIVQPMATEAKEAIWSMGDDAPLAPLATRPRA